MKVWSFIIFGTLFGLGVQQYQQLHIVEVLKSFGVRIPKEKVEVEKVIEVEKPKTSFEQALASRLESASVPKILVDAVLMQEDGARSYRMSLTRYEPSYDDEARRITKNPYEQRMWASSWCPFQIMAPWAKKFGLEDWSDLLDPETCAHVGISILERCWADARGSTALDKVYRLGICYNGPKGQAYAERLVKHVSQAAVNEILER